MLIRRLTPGAFTFILPATRETPRLLVHPKKRTVGIRIPDYPICQRLIETLNRPLLAISARLDGTEYGDPSAGDRRSEERRVGKGRRSGGAPARERERRGEEQKTADGRKHARR